MLNLDTAVTPYEEDEDPLTQSEESDSDASPLTTSADSHLKSPSSPLVASISPDDLDAPHEHDTLVDEQQHHFLPRPAPPVPNKPPATGVAVPAPGEPRPRVVGQTPEAHVPLRRRITQSLKFGRSKSRAAEVEREKANEASRAEIALWLRPQDSQKSRRSSGNKDGATGRLRISLPIQAIMEEEPPREDRPMLEYRIPSEDQLLYKDQIPTGDPVTPGDLNTTGDHNAAGDQIPPRNATLPNDATAPNKSIEPRDQIVTEDPLGPKDSIVPNAPIAPNAPTPAENSQQPQDPTPLGVSIPPADQAAEQQHEIPRKKVISQENQLPQQNQPPQNDPTRPRAGSGLDRTIAPPLASPFPRPTTSTSDYTTNFYRDVSTTSPFVDGGASPAFSEYPASKRPPNFWKDSGVESTRDSVRSALTNGSSVPDLSSNARTSGMTERSSASDTALRNPDWPKEVDEEFTVEDCISMYAQGFTDDPVDEIPPVPPVPPIPEEPVSDMLQGRQLNDITTTQEVSPTNQNDKQPPPPPPVPVKDDTSPTNTSVRTTSTASLWPSSGGVRNSSTLRQRPTRDLYGFKKETQHVTLEQYNAWESDYRRYMERRRRKWIHLMNETGLPSHNPQYFPAKSDKVKRYVRKGIPPEWRGAAWFFYADGASFITTNPGLYHALVAKAADGQLAEADREHIERDLHRTLPENKHFKPDDSSAAPNLDGRPSTSDQVNHPAETEMIRALRRILQAFAIHHPKVGYCQSLNFLAGHLLLFMRAAYPNENYEERAFVLLCILTEKHLPGTHGVVLEGANVDIGVLMMFIQESMPALWAKLDDKTDAAGAGSPAISRKGTAALPTVSLATTAWFMSCFVSTLPIETTCRVWDCLWYEGSKTIFRVALAIFKLGERDIRRSKDPMEMFQVVQNLPRGLLDANALISIATKKRKVPGGDTVSSRISPSVGGFGGLSAKTVESRREERRAMTRRDRERSAAVADGVVPPPIPEEPAPVSRSLSRSSSKSRLKRFRSVKKLVP